MTIPALAPSPETASPAPKARYIGVDIARFLAIVGMMSAHLLVSILILPSDSSDGERALMAAVNTVTNGLPAVLFAILGGVSIVFATRRSLRGGHPGRAIGSIAVRGALLIILGTALGAIDNNIIVVLAYYGMAMLLVSPLVAVRSWIIAVVAAILTLGFGWMNITIRRAMDILDEGPHFSLEFFQEDPAAGLRTLLLTGSYPAGTWAAYILVGILIGRFLTQATARRKLASSALLLAGVGTVVAVIAHLVSTWALRIVIESSDIAAEGWSTEEIMEYTLQYGAPGAPISTLFIGQFIAVPHSGAVGDMIRCIAIACVVIGVLVFLCDRDRKNPPPLRDRPTVGARLLDIVRAAGAAPLTIYTLHIVVTGMLQSPYFHEDAPLLDSVHELPWWTLSYQIFGLQVAGALVVGAILSFTGRRGPLEYLFAKIVSLVIPAPRPGTPKRTLSDTPTTLV